MANPGPGGGLSNSLTLTLLPPLASLTGLFPAAALPGTAIVLKIDGANLANTSSVAFSGSGVAATVLSSSPIALSAVVSVASGAAVGPRTISITTPSGTASFLDRFVVRNTAVKNPITAPQPIPDVEQGPIKSGYVIVTPDSGSSAPSASLTFALIQNASVISQATVLPSAVTTTATLPMNIASVLGRNSGFALVNVLGQNNNLTLTLIDDGGTATANSYTFVLQPYQQLNRFIAELFPSATTEPYFTGSLFLQGSGPFAAIGLDFAGWSFTTVNSSVTSAGSLAPRTSAGSGLVGGVNAMVFPQFVLGGGWASRITLIERGSGHAKGRIDFFDFNGQPLPVKLNGETRSTFTYSISPGGTFVLAPRDQNGQTPI